MRWLMVGCVLLLGCQGTEERCQDIRLQMAVGNLGGTPPRPSDRVWYHEHCWEGRAR